MNYLDSIPRIKGSRQRREPPPHTPYEYPNNLLSTTTIKILDLISEGEIEGFAIKSGIYGADPLCSVFFDDVPVRNLDGSYNFAASGAGFSFGYTLGLSGQAPINGFEKVENIIPLSSNTRISNPPPGAGEVKNVIVSFNTNTYPDADSVKVTVKIPALYEVLLGPKEVAGDTIGYTIGYAIDISLNDGAFSEVFNGSVAGKCSSLYLRQHIFTLPKTSPASNYYKWKVRARRTTQNVQLSRIANDIFIDSIAVMSSSSFSYPASALAGISINADQFNSVPTRAYEIKGLKIAIPQGYTPTVYNASGTITQAIYPNVWLGNFSTTKTWTDNPAWIYYDLITNKRYGLGNYIQPDLIDKWTLYEIAQYCDELVDDGKGGLEPRFTCNIVIQQRQDAYNLLLNLSSVFRGMLYWANGRLFANSTNDTNPLYTFTNANVTEGRFNYSDTAKNTRSTVVKVRWNDPESLYRENLEYIEDTQGVAKYGYIEKEITAFACTSKGQAYRIGDWVLQTEQLLTETVAFQAGLEGNYLKPGDVFTIYDNFRNNKFQGGRVANFKSGIYESYPLIMDARAKIQLDRPVNLRANDSNFITVVVPKFNFEATGDITGSNQIEYIRNTQTENRLILSNGTGLNELIIESGFSDIANKYAIWTISNSGQSNFYDHGTIGGLWTESIRSSEDQFSLVSSGWTGNGLQMLKTGVGSQSILSFPATKDHVVNAATWEMMIKLDAWNDVAGSRADIYELGSFWGLSLRNGCPLSRFIHQEIQSNTPLQTGVWTHISNVYTGPSGFLYVNGVLVSGATTTNAELNPFTYNKLISLGQYAGAQARFSGTIDEVRFWNYARSAAEIAANYNVHFDVAPSGLINYLTFDNTGLPLSVLDQSTSYRCLSTSESEPGKVEVLGVEINTGINNSIEINYSVINNPVNSGDNTPISPPSGLQVAIVTGLTAVGGFYSYIGLGWMPPQATNLGYYRVSGLEFGGSWENIGNMTSTGTTYGIGSTGYYLFQVNAVSIGGMESSYITGGVLVPSTNPLGAISGLASLYISENADYSYLSGALTVTGYIGRTPAFAWTVPSGLDGLPVPEAQFISGYRIKILNAANTDLITPVIVGYDTTDFQLEGTTIQSFVGGPQRFFKVQILALDFFGGSTVGGTLSVNNPPARPPLYSGFNGGLGGVNYTINPDGRDSDITGVYMWFNTGIITPSFDNFNFFSPNLGGFAFNNITGQYNAWFALGDTFGTGNTPIYGPLPVIANIGVTGISVTGSNPPLQGTVNIRGTGLTRVFLDQNTILISGYPADMIGAGNVTLHQSGVYTVISGERDYFNLSFYLDTVQSGLYIGEALISKNFIFTGYAISCRTAGNALTGNLYTDNYSNTNNVNFSTLLLGNGQNNYTSGGFDLPITGNRKIGFNITNLVTGIQKLSIGVYGYNVGI